VKSVVPNVSRWAWDMESKPPVRYRKLRIAWSVGCGALCLLLIALWVRSYSRWGGFAISPVKDTVVQVYGVKGRAELLIAHAVGYGASPQFHITPIDPINDESVAILDDRMQRLASPRLGFGFWAGSNGALVIVPGWFLVSVAAASAVSPWLPWRFSLRTLLIASTLVAIILGIIVVSN
jgi:hypothetical protein